MFLVLFAWSFPCHVFRYIDKVKFIVLSAPLSRVHWHQAIQLGWFCHFPIVPDSDETCNNERSKFLQVTCIKSAVCV